MAKSDKIKIASETPPLTEKVLRRRDRRFILISFLLVFITIAAFWGVCSASFVRMDDEVYVTENRQVQAGITWENVKWAFSTTYFGFYYPVTWLSHMLDCQVYGNWAGGHHLTSLILHILNALILFFALERMSGAVWRSGIVAALFAVHPLHVESVAWVAERKDVLCTFFWFLSLLAYSWYAEKPSVTRNIMVISAFLCGLLAKPMLVTLPFLLLLLDYWPLRRWPKREQSPEDGDRSKLRYSSLIPAKLLLEKLPLFAVVPVFSVVAFIAQKQADAVASAADLSLTERAANALISYAAYIKMMLFPVNLAVLYPMPREGVSYWTAAICGSLLTAAFAGAVFIGRTHRYVLVGWLWYMGTLVPVIGLVQIGSQSMADRYSYVPLIGVFILIVWGISELVEGRRSVRTIAIASSVIVIAALVLLTREQVGYWKNSVTLLEHAISVTSENWMAHNNLGIALYQQGRKDEALVHYLEAARIEPNNPKVRLNLGCALEESGRADEAVRQCAIAVKLAPDNPKAFNNLGIALVKENRPKEAVENFREAIRLDPLFFEARNNMGNALAQMGDLEAAEEVYKEAVRIMPDSPIARNSLGITLARRGKIFEAAAQFREALRISPDFVEAQKNLEKAEKILREKGK